MEQGPEPMRQPDDGLLGSAGPQAPAGDMILANAIDGILTRSIIPKLSIQKTNLCFKDRVSVHSHMKASTKKRQA